MHRPKSTRQFVLFLVSAVLPAIVLVGLAVYVIRQDAELTSRRAADERVRALDQARRGLASSLNEIALGEINRRLSNAETSPTGIVFAAPMDLLREALQTRSVASNLTEGQKLWERQTTEQLESLGANRKERSS